MSGITIDLSEEQVDIMMEILIVRMAELRALMPLPKWDANIQALSKCIDLAYALGRGDEL